MQDEFTALTEELRQQIGITPTEFLNLLSYATLPPALEELLKRNAAAVERQLNQGSA